MERKERLIEMLLEGTPKMSREEERILYMDFAKGFATLRPFRGKYANLIKEYYADNGMDNERKVYDKQFKLMSHYGWDAAFHDTYSDFARWYNRKYGRR